MFHNPVIPGFHPDPSICRVGEDYYLVTSSFEWFPGLPVFHSRDLVHWRQLGHALDRPSQLDLDGCGPSRGLFAPTLRHHDGVFHLVCTLMDGPGHFVVTATDPSGPWSEPHWLEGEGFDPSLFFDDGRAWFTATRGHVRTEIWMREYDPVGLRLIGPEHVLWTGAVWSEAPHLYKVDGLYYLVTAEGGTAHDHSVMVARSSEVTGPYEGAPHNPVLTHRHLPHDAPITSTGHADLVQTPAGDWWSVLLAVRPGLALGRETFLTPVSFADGWPVPAPVLAARDSPALPAHPWPPEPVRDDFSVLRPCWNTLRTPRSQFWTLGPPLRLRLRPEQITDLANPSLLARRREHPACDVATELTFHPANEHEHAGLAVLNHEAHLLFVLTADGLCLIRDGEVLASADLPAGTVRLGIDIRDQTHTFRYSREPDTWLTLATVDGGFLDSSVTGGFTGANLGLYASSNGHPSESHAEFTWFDYAPR